MLKFNVSVTMLDNGNMDNFEMEAESSAKCYLAVARKYWGTKIKIDVTTA